MDNPTPTTTSDSHLTAPFAQMPPVSQQGQLQAFAPHLVNTATSVATNALLAPQQPAPETPFVGKTTDQRFLTRRGLEDIKGTFQGYWAKHADQLNAVKKMSASDHSTSHVAVWAVLKKDEMDPTNQAKWSVQLFDSKEAAEQVATKSDTERAELARIKQDEWDQENYNTIVEINGQFYGIYFDVSSMKHFYRRTDSEGLPALKQMQAEGQDAKALLDGSTPYIDQGTRHQPGPYSVLVTDGYKLVAQSGITATNAPVQYDVRPINPRLQTVAAPQVLAQTLMIEQQQRCQFDTQCGLNTGSLNSSSRVFVMGCPDGIFRATFVADGKVLQVADPCPQIVEQQVAQKLLVSKVTANNTSKVAKATDLMVEVNGKFYTLMQATSASSSSPQANLVIVGPFASKDLLDGAKAKRYKMDAKDILANLNALAQRDQEFLLNESDLIPGKQKANMLQSSTNRACFRSADHYHAGKKTPSGLEVQVFDAHTLNFSRVLNQSGGMPLELRIEVELLRSGLHRDDICLEDTASRSQQPCIGVVTLPANGGKFLVRSISEEQLRSAKARRYLDAIPVSEKRTAVYHTNGQFFAQFEQPLQGWVFAGPYDSMGALFKDHQEAEATMDQYNAAKEQTLQYVTEKGGDLLKSAGGFLSSAWGGLKDLATQQQGSTTRVSVPRSQPSQQPLSATPVTAPQARRTRTPISEDSFVIGGTPVNFAQTQRPPIELYCESPLFALKQFDSGILGLEPIPQQQPLSSTTTSPVPSPLTVPTTTAQPRHPSQSPLQPPPPPTTLASSPQQPLSSRPASQPSFLLQPSMMMPKLPAPATTKADTLSSDPSSSAFSLLRPEATKHSATPFTLRTGPSLSDLPQQPWQQPGSLVPPTFAHPDTLASQQLQQRPGMVDPYQAQPPQFGFPGGQPQRGQLAYSCESSTSYRPTGLQPQQTEEALRQARMQAQQMREETLRLATGTLAPPQPSPLLAQHQVHPILTTTASSLLAPPQQQPPFQAQPPQHPPTTQHAQLPQQPPTAHHVQPPQQQHQTAQTVQTAVGGDDLLALLMQSQTSGTFTATHIPTSKHS